MVAIDIDMSSECLKCDFLISFSFDFCCMFTGKTEFYDKERRKDCPLIDVEGKYIIKKKQTGEKCLICL